LVAWCVAKSSRGWAWTNADSPPVARHHAADVLQWYRNLGLDLIEVYGMTENCGVSHSTLPGSR
jgi:hypothetical protein